MLDGFTIFELIENIQLQKIYENWIPLEIKKFIVWKRKKNSENRKNIFLVFYSSRWSSTSVKVLSRKYYSIQHLSKKSLSKRKVLLLTRSFVVYWCRNFINLGIISVESSVNGWNGVVGYRFPILTKWAQTTEKSSNSLDLSKRKKCFALMSTSSLFFNNFIIVSKSKKFPLSSSSFPNYLQSFFYAEIKEKEIIKIVESSVCSYKLFTIQSWKKAKQTVTGPAQKTTRRTNCNRI